MIQVLLRQLNGCWYHSLRYQKRKEGHSEIPALRVLCLKCDTPMKGHGPGAQEGKET